MESRGTRIKGGKDLHTRGARVDMNQYVKKGQTCVQNGE